MGEIGSGKRQKEARMDSLAFGPSASASLGALDVDSCSSDIADSKLCSSDNWSSSDGDEYSKLFESKR